MNLLVITLALATSPAETPKPVAAPTFEVGEYAPQQGRVTLADGGIRMPPKGRVTLADGGIRMPPKGRVTLADGGIRMPPKGLQG